METASMKEFAEAMVLFQFKCPAIFKDEQVTVRTEKGPGYVFEFASYGNIIQTIKPFMNEAKLSYKFLTTADKFVCRIRHVSGEFEDTEIDKPKMKEKMQDNGAVLSYLKRYSLVLALGLDTDADNDGADEGEIDKKKHKPKGVEADVKKFIKTKDLSLYEVKVGKFKGMKLGEIDQIKIQDYLTWLHGQTKTNNRPLSGDWLEFAKISEAYISPPETPPESLD